MFVFSGMMVIRLSFVLVLHLFGEHGGLGGLFNL